MYPWAAAQEAGPPRRRPRGGERRGRDSNPRIGLTPINRLAGGCLQPLGHLSARGPYRSGRSPERLAGPARRGGRAVECGGLENRWPGRTGSWVRIPPPPLTARKPRWRLGCPELAEVPWSSALNRSESLLGARDSPICLPRTTPGITMLPGFSRHRWRGAGRRSGARRPRHATVVAAEREDEGVHVNPSRTPSPRRFASYLDERLGCGAGRGFGRSETAIAE